MKTRLRIASALILVALLSPAAFYSRQNAAQTPATTDPATGLSTSQMLDRALVREKQVMAKIKTFKPLVETYLQVQELDDKLGAVPKSDKYFLGKLDLTEGFTQKSLLPEPGLFSKIKGKVTQLWSAQYLPNGFAQMIVIDNQHFDRGNYDFEYIQREFLGEVRCLVFDVQPKKSSEKAAFWGRIWVEDRDFTIVRFNGTYGQNNATDMYFHFDSWRENLTGDLWLPAYIYTEESNMPYLLGRRKLRFKGKTRVWGYNSGKPAAQDELTSLKVEQVQDNVDQAQAMSPVASYRAWERHAEDNILTRMEKAGVLAPVGEVDKVLETVITNLEVTNNLVLEPSVRARVLITSPLESLTVGRTIVMSRGLVDVLPDEASLAMVLAHELAHIVLGHRLDTKYAFHDRMIFEDPETFKRFSIKRDPKEEADADTKAAELLKNSPYREKLAMAGLFLRAVGDSGAVLTQLLRPHVGNYMVQDSKVQRMTELMLKAPELKKASIDQISALPLGARVRVNPWNNRMELMKAPPTPILYPHEKLPFEVTPVALYLTRAQPDAGNVAVKQNQ